MGLSNVADTSRCSNADKLKDKVEVVEGTTAGAMIASERRLRRWCPALNDDDDADAV